METSARRSIRFCQFNKTSRGELSVEPTCWKAVATLVQVFGPTRQAELEEKNFVTSEAMFCIAEQGVQTLTLIPVELS